MITLLLTYKYFILLPLAIVEGPIITVVAGFLVSTGLLSIVPVYLIVLLGDVIGDTIAYSIGRFGGSTLIHRYGHRIGLTPEKLEQTKEYFKNNHGKALLFSKIFHGVGVAGLIAAGSLQIPYLRYIRICFFISALQSAIFLLIGVLFGGAYIQIQKYFDYFAATISVIVLLVTFFIIFFHIKSRSQIPKI